MRKLSNQMHLDLSPWMGDVLLFDRQYKPVRWAAFEAKGRSERHFMARVNAWNRRYIGEQQAEGYMRRSVGLWATKVAKANPPRVWREISRDQARAERNGTMRANEFHLRGDEK